MANDAALFLSEMIESREKEIEDLHTVTQTKDRWLTDEKRGAIKRLLSELKREHTILKSSLAELL